MFDWDCTRLCTYTFACVLSALRSASPDHSVTGDDPLEWRFEKRHTPEIGVVTPSPYGIGDLGSIPRRVAP